MRTGGRGTIISSAPAAMRDGICGGGGRGIGERRLLSSPLFTGGNRRPSSDPRGAIGLATSRELRQDSGMTRLLEQAPATVSAMPDKMQDEVARMLLTFAGIEQPPIQLTPE